MLGESRRQSACPAASKGTLPDYGSDFILQQLRTEECERNVTDACSPLFSGMPGKPSHRHESLHSGGHLEMEVVQIENPSRAES